MPLSRLAPRNDILILLQCEKHSSEIQLINSVEKYNCKLQLPLSTLPPCNDILVLQANTALHYEKYSLETQFRNTVEKYNCKLQLPLSLLPDVTTY